MSASWIDAVDKFVVGECASDAISNGEGRFDVHAFMRYLDKNDYQIVPTERDRGDGRQEHYGDGQQPWDLCKRLGWAQYGAAFNILRYLRRTKTPERDLKHARVYYGWLRELALIDRGGGVGEPNVDYGMSLRIFRRLVRDVLLDDECAKLGVTEEDKTL